MNIIRKIPVAAVVALIRVYQYVVSPWLGGRCRFYPSCSEYFCGCLRRYGLIRGLGKGIVRIAKCHPFHPGGYDPV